MDLAKTMGVVVVLLALAGPSCAPERPRMGGPPAAIPPPEGYRIRLESASVTGAGDAPRQVYVNFALSKDERPLAGAAGAGLGPSWTLAVLGVEPVSGAPAWKSLVLTGEQTVPRLPVAGPGSDATCVAGEPCPGVLVGVRQPGVDAGGTLIDHGDGSYTYVFEHAIEPVDAAATLRVGVFLGAVPGTSLTSATLDFRPDGGPVSTRELVLESRCNSCHDTVRAHDGHRVGASLCVTCHTHQNADPDTIDPAAMEGLGATPATDPNPLEFGRLVHRIHRGRTMPTLYRSSSSDPAEPLEGATAVATPFEPTHSAPVAGRKFAVVGANSLERVFGRVASRDDNGQPARAVALGILFPRDYRDCDACHAGAKQAAAVTTELSRRSCQGCHPDVWFGAGATDPVHLAHPGGPQQDDSRCGGCHLEPGNPTAYAPIAKVHVPPRKSGHLDFPVAEIVSVHDFAPGKRPTVCFRVTDRLGLVSPLNTTAVAPDAAEHPIPRGLSFFGMTISGPTKQYAWGAVDPDVAPTNEMFFDPRSPPLTLADDPAMRTVCPAGTLEYRFRAKIPDDATGTWGLGLEGRRGGYPQPVVPATATTHEKLRLPLVWPYGPEGLYEAFDNPLLFVDLGGGTPTLARRIVDMDLCERCHDRVQFHGTTRHQVRYCEMCHAVDRTDFDRRPRHPPGTPLAGTVNLSTVYTWTPYFAYDPYAYGTNDGVEERSIDFKVLIHRIHTGGRKGSARLETVRPFLGYILPGGATSARFFDEVIFPGTLSDCTRCHLPGTYRPESVPEGALPTVANETPTIQHRGTAAHADAEARVPAVQSACLGCHATAFVQGHATRYTSGGKEQCVSCHGEAGAYAVRKVHGVWDPDAPPVAP